MKPNKLGVKWGTVLLMPYQNEWEQAFIIEKNSLFKGLNSVVLAIEHVGSTAIKGALAKPIIDIAVLVNDINLSFQFDDFLTNLNYKERVGRFDGPIRVFMKMKVDNIVSYHLHFIEKGNPEWDKKLLFRNILNSNTKKLNEYNALKQKLYAEFKHQRKLYTAGKTAFIKQTLTFSSILNYIKNLPYGRNLSKSYSLVLTEQKGTCSSKHAYAKYVANLFNVENVELVLCMFKMSAKHFPEINSILIAKRLNYIPEAHCYLKWNNTIYDITNSNSNYEKIKDDILLEFVIEPNFTISKKTSFHKNYLNNWLKTQNLNISSDLLWQIREDCIIALH